MLSPKRLIFVIMMVFSCIVMYGITRQGIHDEDGLLYYTAARTDIAVAKWILAGKSYSLHDYLMEHRIYARSNYYGKPLFHFISILSLLVFGDYDYSAQIMCGLFGIITIFIVYKLTELMYNTTAGLFTAAFLTMSPIFIWLARTNMAHMPQLCFFFAGMYFYMLNTKTQDNLKNKLIILASGLCMALSFYTHLSAVSVIAWFALYEIYLLLTMEKGFLFFLRRWGLFLLPAIILFFVINGALSSFKTVMGKEALKEYVGSGGIYMNYVQQLVFNANATIGNKVDESDKSPVSTLTNLPASKVKFMEYMKSYVYDPWVYEGTIRCVLMLAAILFVLKDYKNTLNLFMAILIIIPYVFFVTPVSNPSIRTVLTMFPLLAIAVGKLMDTVFSRIKNKYVTLGVSVIILALLAPDIFALYNVHVGFRNVADFLKQRDVRSVLRLDIHTQVDPYLDIYGVNTVLLRDPKLIAGYSDIEYTAIALRSSFFSPLTDNDSLRFAKEAVKKHPVIMEDDFTTSLTAMDMYRRQHSFIVNKLIVNILGNNYRREPIKIYLFKTANLARQ
ncbi:MAG: glycosyltransferase family 39 protein [Nitrospirae bacterium]|nr:glycosyltransferase family 39 protein [Nitrospirota bacterium]